MSAAKKLKPSDPASSFVAGAIAHPINTTGLGENAHPQVTREGLNDDLLFLFDKAVRGISWEEVKSLAEALVNAAGTSKDDIIDLYLLAFQTRWARGGKGEKLIFYQLTNLLYKHLPSTTLSVLEHMPHFGYWKDGLLLLQECCVTHKICSDASLDILKAKIYMMFVRQLKADHDELTKARAATPPRHPNLSFCAKFAPTENKEFDKLLGCVAPIAKLITPTEKDNAKATKNSIKVYRQMCTALRAELEIPEVKMASGHFSEINFERVTSNCLHRRMKAFLNERLKDSKMNTGDYDETGDRFPENEDRVAARKNLLDLIIKKGAVKGATLFPHELVQTCQQGRNSSTGAKAVMNAQWVTMRENVIKMAEERRKKVEEEAASKDVPQAASKPLDLGKLIIMSDVSGSMSGTPMLVSIAMGILISEICNPAFRDLVLTFDDNPVFHNLKGKATFTEKVESLARAPWGGSTDFEKAFNLILDVIKRNKLTQEEIPDLMVVSDMQFNQTMGYGYYGGGKGGSAWSTASENIRQAFADLGNEMYGKPFEMPNIIFWNVRSGTAGAPAKGDDEGVVLLSGYSPALMKFVLSGDLMDEVEDIEVDEETGEVKKVKRKITPKEALRKVLDDDGLAVIKEAIVESGALDEEFALLSGSGKK